jgi:hypothetical protein
MPGCERRSRVTHDPSPRPNVIDGAAAPRKFSRPGHLWKPYLPPSPDPIKRPLRRRRGAQHRRYQSLPFSPLLSLGNIRRSGNPSRRARVAFGCRWSRRRCQAEESSRRCCSASSPTTPASSPLSSTVEMFCLHRR